MMQGGLGSNERKKEGKDVGSKDKPFNNQEIQEYEDIKQAGV